MGLANNIQRARLDTLELAKKELTDKVKDLKKKSVKSEKDYESLRQFKCTVSDSQNSFSAVSSKNQKILAGINEVKKNNSVAQKYYNGMQHTLEDISSSIVSIIYTALVSGVSKKMESEKEDVEDYNNKIDIYNKKIKDIEEEIELIKKTMING